MNIRFDGKVVAVSGGGHGIGRAIARSFAALGAVVFAADNNAENLRETASSGNITPAVVDLADRRAAAAWIADVERRIGGRSIFALVNNCGGVAGQTNKPIEQVTDEEWDAIFAVNIGAAMALSRAVAPGMKRARAGRIIIISSGAGLQASLTGIQAYCAAKHAEVGLTRQLCHDLGPFGITVNSVAPGFIRSNPSTEKQWESYGPEGQKALVERIALKHLGTAQNIADAVLFFASDLASFVSGQVLSVDGGR
jgi:3-oxoacyl-[acyl-carrier protein] reductase